ncbi:MAG: LPS export ABC transporter periplasmic protein LptC [Longimicrobiales bacterium]
MRAHYSIALVTLVGLTAACGQQTGPTGEDFQEVPADLIMIDMTSFMTSNGVRKARLQGDTAHVYDDSAKVAVKGVRLAFFDEQGNQSGSLTSSTGDFNTVTQAMIARGKVVLVTALGNRRIETEELHYDPQTHRLWSTMKTLMVEGENRSTGDGFEADDKFENVKVKNPKGRASGLKIQF